MKCLECGEKEIYSDNKCKECYNKHLKELGVMFAKVSREVELEKYLGSAKL